MSEIEGDHLHTRAQSEPKKRQQRGKKRVHEEVDEDEGNPQFQSKELEKLYNLFKKTTDSIESQLANLGEEVKRVKESQTIRVLTPDGSAPSPTIMGTTLQIQQSERPYYNINWNVEKPKFERKDNIHPVDFVEELASYLRKVPTASGTNEIDIIVECLKGEARSWARIYKNRWQTFEDFKREFLDVYWGESAQAKVRRSITHNVWDRTKTPTMLSHFINLTGQVKMLNYEIPEKQLVDDIMRHYPKSVQSLWIISQGKTILEATEFLKKVDDVHKFDADENKQSKEKKEEKIQDKNTNYKYNSNYKPFKKSEGQKEYRNGQKTDKPKVQAAVIEAEPLSDGANTAEV